MSRITRSLPASSLTLGLAFSCLVIAPAHAQPEAPVLDTELLNERTEWSYLDDGTAPAHDLDTFSDWAKPGFDDSDWKTGRSSFGTRQSADTVLQQHEPDTDENLAAYFFRTEFTVDAASLHHSVDVTGSLTLSDAAIVYINGQRVDAFNADQLELPTEGDAPNMAHSGSVLDAPLEAELQFDGQLLNEGENTIAVQVHQAAADGAGAFFSMESLNLNIEPGNADEPDTSDATDESAPATDPAPAQDSATSDQNAILLQMGADPSERRLSWLTDSGVDEWVQLAAGEYATMPDIAQTFAAIQQANSAHRGQQYVHATLTDLTPGTYSYRVGSDEGGWSDLEHFRVYPNDVNHTFTFMGDAQLGSSRNLERDAAGWQAALDASDELFPASQFMLSAGDQVETYTGNPDEYLAYIAPQQMRTQPSAATLGNHDINLLGTRPQALYGQHFNQPNMADYDTTGGTYWFKYNDVLHLNISTEYRNWGDHRAFLESIIEEHGADAHWTMLTFHRPLYSVANHSTSGTTNAIRNGLGPIVNELDIDLVLTGHDHSYSRSFLIDAQGQQVDPATSEVVVDAAGEVIDAPEPTEDLNLGYAGRESSPRLDDGTHIRLTPEQDETLFVTASSSSGSKFYDMRRANEYRDGFQPRFRDQQYEQNITGVEVEQCTITTNTVELDGTVVDKVELLRDHTAPVITASDTTVEQGEAFDPFAEVEVSDDCAVLTAEDLEVAGEVDTDQPGEYSLTYRTADDAGNDIEIERVVTVVETTESDQDAETPGPEDDQEQTPAPSPDPEADDDLGSEPDTSGNADLDEETPGSENEERPGSGGNTDLDDVTPGTGNESDETLPSVQTPDPENSGGRLSGNETERVADTTGSSGFLANTGASIIAAVTIGVAAIGSGIALFMSRRKRQSS